jgi:hypothetical protein
VPREPIPEPTGSYDGLDAKHVRRLSELAASLGLDSITIDEFIELILRDGWRRGIW